MQQFIQTNQQLIGDLIMGALILFLIIDLSIAINKKVRTNKKQDNGPHI